MGWLRGFGHLKEQPDWPQFLLMASLLVLVGYFIPLVGTIVTMLVLYGWSAIFLRRLVGGSSLGLPALDFDLSRLEHYCKYGLKIYIVQLVWALPMIVFTFFVLCAGQITMALGVFGVSGGAYAAGETGAAVGGLGALLFGVVSLFVLFIGNMFFSVYMQAALIRVELTDEVKAGFAFKEILDMVKLILVPAIWGGFVVGLVCSALMLFGMLFFCVGVYPAMIMMFILQTGYRAELYRIYLERGGAPLTIAPVVFDEAPNAPSGPAVF